MKRVLVVDDSELTIVQLGDALVGLGYEVSGSASSGLEAIEQAKRLRPDVVLMDIVMPGPMDGIGAAQKIRADLDIPVVLLTGYEDEKSIDRIRDVHVDGYVMKPVRSLELKASIEIAVQKKRTESRFRDLYREVVEKTSDLVYVVDGQGNIKYANDQIVKLGGYEREDTIGKNFASFLTPESLKYSAEIFRRHLDREDVGPFELEFFDSDGNIHIMEMRERLVWDKDTVVEVHGIGRDVTERKHAEQELRQSEEKFRGVFETSPDFMYIASRDGRIIDYNPSTKDLFGYTDEEIRNLSLADIYVDPNERHQLEDILESKDFVHNHELRLRRKDGSLIDALATITVTKDRNGTVTGSQGAVKDITQMKRMERQLLQVEKLSSLGTMVSGIAHELNNPLTAIMGNAELLSMNKNITDREKRSLDVILHESLRAAKIVSGLLTFAREHRAERWLINVNDVVAESLILREYNLRVNNISVQQHLCDNMPPTFADPHQLQQVFINIINNASDALTEKGGGKLVISTRQEDDTLMVMFEDDGPGINKEHIQKLFDPFFTTKEVGRGTGLGLSIAYGIVEEHGGTIEVESEPGRGARFTVELPITKGRSQSPISQTERPQSALPGKSILIVDDEAPVRDFLSELLLREGHTVQTASAAADAIGMMKDTAYDAVVADIRMPGMDGMEFYTYILREYPELSKKILFITGDTLSQEIEVFLRISNADIITKPFTMDRILTGLNRIFES